ncbi:Abi family protein [Corynebacterium sp. CNCTC7651]
MPRPVKRFTTVEEQIEILETRGLTLDRAEAEKWLRVVNYYRLSGYSYPFRDSHGGKPTDHFIPGASFGQVVALYEFDRKMSTLVYDAVQRVEVAFRAKNDP